MCMLDTGLQSQEDRLNSDELMDLFRQSIKIVLTQNCDGVLIKDIQHKIEVRESLYMFK